MKFGKKLKIQIQETLPEWQDKFLCYKDLKKLVRLISSVPSVTSTLARRRFSDDQSSLEKDETEFVYLLNIEIEKFNAFFMEQEKDFIIRHEEFIQEQITRVLLEHLIVNRPHPWGLLITFIELIKNPRYSFWTRSFPRCAPEIEKLFESISRSCGVPKAVDDNMVSGGISDSTH